MAHCESSTAALTHRDNLSSGNVGSDAPHEQRAGLVERPRSGRIILGLLFLFLFHFGLFFRLFFLFLIEIVKVWSEEQYENVHELYTELNLNLKSPNKLNFKLQCKK